MTLDVLCVGAATIDTIAVVDWMPGEDERVITDPFVTAGGGPAATAAVALARLGASVGFCGTVGDDAAGELVREGLEREGVDTTWLSVEPGARTTESIVLVSRASGARTIVTTPSQPSGAGLVPTRAAEWIHVDQAGYARVRDALDGASSAVRLSVDAGNPIPGLSLNGVSLFAPTVDTLRRLHPAADLESSMRAAGAAGAQSVVATAGSDGSYVLVGGEVVRVPPFEVDIVSTMGAGDVFHGAILAGLVSGLGLVDATLSANAVAALSCQALDGRSGIPDASTAAQFVTTAGALRSSTDRNHKGEQ
jgi:sugar/nucleoside kinase (ribokinase family)